MEPGTEGLLLAGRVRTPQPVTLERLRALPQHDAEGVFACGGSGPRKHWFRGPRLVEVLTLARPLFAEGDRKDRLRFWISVLGGDGHRLVLSWGELDAEFGNAPILLGVRLDGRDLHGCGPQLVVPGDLCGARYVSDITEIRLETFDPPNPTDRTDHADRTGRTGRTDRTDSTDHADRTDGTDLPARIDRAGGTVDAGPGRAAG